MRNRLLAAFVAAVAFSTSFDVSAAYNYQSPYTSPQYLGPANGGQTENDWRANKVKHFGYAVLPTAEDGGASAGALAALIPELKKHSNTVAVIHKADNPSGNNSVYSQLDQNLKGIVFVDDVFFQTNGQALNEITIAERLSQLKAHLGAQKAHVAYMAFDESVLRRQVARCNTLFPNPSTQAGRDAAIRCWSEGPTDDVLMDVIPNLERFAQKIREAFPGMGIMYIEAYAMIPNSAANLRLPANFDLYGFDCYDPYMQCGLGVQPGPIRTASSIFQTLKAGVNALNLNGGNRKLAVVPPGHVYYPRAAILSTTGSMNIQGQGYDGVTIDSRLVPGGVSPANDAAAKLRAEEYVMGLGRDPRVYLIGGFLYNSVGDRDIAWMGIRALPQTRAFYLNLGYEITGKSIPWDPSPPRIEFVVTSGIKVGERPIWIWAAQGANSCRSVTEPTQYQNLTPNGAITGDVEPVPRSIFYTIECTGAFGTSQKSLTYTVR